MKDANPVALGQSADTETTRADLAGGSARRLTVSRHFTSPGSDPYKEITWESRSAAITNEHGELVFEQSQVEIPSFWSQTATNVVVSKYFRGPLGTPKRESSVRQLVGRVVNTITGWGIQDGYFAGEEDAENFRAELTHLLLTQKASFNSPVWFNVGIEQRPQCSACQPYHALVNTVDGPMPIGEIVERNLIGLPVHDGDGLTQVVAVKHNGRKPVYRVTLNDGFSIEATPDHLVCAHEARRTRRVEWQRVDKLKVGMVMRVYPHAAETVTAPASTQAVAEAALAGWLQADGFVGQYSEGTNRSLTVEFMTVDDQEHAWVMQHLDTAFPGHHRKITEVPTDDTSLRCRRIRLYGESLRPFVEQYGLLRRREDLRVPDPLWRASNDAVSSYLKSLFQSDGYASVQVPSARVGFAVISKEWTKDIQQLLTRFGIYTRLRTRTETREDRQDLHQLDLSIRSERDRFCRHVGFISERKNSKLRESLRLPGKACPTVRYSQIVSIEPLGEMDVYDIQTRSGKYLTNSVLVHNCFILSVQDTMESILDWYKTEGMIFKYGSGSGINLSPIRSAKEQLAGGGTASGPVSFMRAADASAGVIKSGGKTRRAAKMIVLNADHPDIERFIRCKWDEERKAWTLVDAGYSSSIDGEAYSSVFFQNANNSVRVTDEFMQAVLDDKPWELKAVTTGQPMETARARELMRLIAEATWHCGDPGMQFDTTYNRWHTCPNSGRINATNPCSEYAHVDDSACNLASLNLMKFLDDSDRFQIADFRAAVRTLIIAMDIIVDNSSYPTPKITENAKAFRELGLGYANLGALLMNLGLPYDSDGGRAYASTVTALMCGEAYRTSTEIAGAKGPYAGYAKNKEPQLRVIRMHRDALVKVDDRLVPGELFAAAAHVWDEALRLGAQNGVRNSQVSVCAPTGTIGFMMDCDTTGVEPDIALIKYKKLVGGGLMKIVNTSVPRALERLGYAPDEIQRICGHLDKEETIERAPGLKPEHLPVFDCAFKPVKGTRSIHYMGHVRMMAAVQPFISGSISKTVNVPAEATVEEIMHAYIESWKSGVKAIAIYRDGSKRVQPLSTGKSDEAARKREKASAEELAEAPGAGSKAKRHYLPDERHAITHKFSIAGHDGYVTVGLYEDGKPGEIFIVMSKEGTVISGLLDAFATAISLAMQYGVPLEALVKKFSHMRFEPAGITSNPQIRFAQSILDYVFRWMSLKFLPREVQPTPPATVTDLAAKEADITVPKPTEGTASTLTPTRQAFQGQVDAPPCHSCGQLMVRSGNCYKCFNCGETSGCS